MEGQQDALVAGMAEPRSEREGAVRPRRVLSAKERSLGVWGEGIKPVEFLKPESEGLRYGL